jgi:dGTPase
MTAPGNLFAFTEDQRAYLRETQQQDESRLSPFAMHHSEAIYRNPEPIDPETEFYRPAFTRDVDRILNNAFFNRCMDKTQVFPFYRNDDLTRRSFHLQLVSQTARKIGRALRLNCDLIEAIALGHDLGHTPFGHAGEHALSALYREHTGRYFNHNVHSVRLLQDVAKVNISLQTLNGILCHCGERAFKEYRPEPCSSFDELDTLMERCYTQRGASEILRPSTLEGCVVRICDMLAYLGKDRQDALTIGAISPEEYYLKENILGRTNSDIIRNASNNLIKNSIEKGYLAMDEEVFSALLAIKDENWQLIYQSKEAQGVLDRHIDAMMERLYGHLREEAFRGDETSYLFRHHVHSWVMQFNPGYESTDPDDLVCDYIASMTDAYFIALHNHLFPAEAVSEQEIYHPYF